MTEDQRTAVGKTTVVRTGPSPQVPPSSPESGRLRLVASNATANLVRGLSTTLLYVVLPIALVRLLSPQDFAAWTLVFSASLYVLYLDLGLLGSITTLVARAHAAADRELAHSYVTAGLRLAAAIGAAVLIGYAALAASLGTIFPDLPNHERASARIALLALAGAQVLTLFTNVIIGYFNGLQRSRVAAQVIMLGRAATFAVSCILAALGVGIAGVAFGFLSASGVTLLGLGYRYSRERVLGRPAAKRPGLGPSRQLLAMCGVLGVHSFCMLLVSGLDVAIVGRLDYAKVGAYGIAASLATLLAGLLGAAISPLLPEFTRMAEQGRAARLVKLLRRLSEAITQLLGLIVVAFMLIATPLLHVVGGDQLGGAAVPFAIVLIAGTAIRQSGAATTLAVISIAGGRRLLVLPALAEGVVNVGLSIFLCTQVGAIGVAFGTAAGAIVSIVAWTCIVLPRREEFKGFTRAQAVYGWFVPLVVLAPALAASSVPYWVTTTPLIHALVVIAGLLVSGLIAACIPSTRQSLQDARRALGGVRARLSRETL